MVDKAELRQRINDFIPQINSAGKTFDLFRLLNYPKETILDETYKRKLEEFDFKKEEKDKINNIYTVLSFEKNLSVFLVETKTLAPAFIRYITNVFSDRYMRCLLILTIDYTDIVVVFPDYEKIEVGKHKLKITKLHLNKDEIYYTDLETLSNIFYEGKEATWRDVWYKWREAFNVEKVTEKFFEDYQDRFFMLRKALEKQKINTKDAHEFTLQFLNRVMFIYFVSKKRWLNENIKFMKWFWTRYKEERNKGTFDKDSFYERWLRVVFFEVFNNRPYALKELPKDVKEALSNVPFLNGGLFRETDTDKLPIKIEDSLFKEIFNFFENYNFTIKEDMPLEKEVAINPQMIGYVYESLANVAEEIYDRTDLGIFYTPKVEVDFMCRRSLVEYLSKHLSDIPKDKIYELLFDEDKENIEKYFDDRKYWYKLEEILDNLSVVDPACGSGAFLVGTLNVLAELYKIIYRHLNRKLTDFQLKNNIINRSLYGVDVMPWAVHAAELRLWLQLIIETEFKKEELRGKALLPTLNLNLRVGDSLVQEIGGMSLHLREANISNRLKKKLYELKSEKEKYFNNDPTAKFKDKKDLLKEEAMIFEEIADERISALKIEEKNLKDIIEKLRKTKQTDLFGGMAESEQKKIIDETEIKKIQLDEIEKKIVELENVKIHLHDPEKKPFVWEIDFAEIFGDKGGFDVVIGNPPYVPYKKISPPNILKKDVTKEQKREYKEKLISSVKTRFAVIENVNGMSDYYIYFYFHGLSLLNPRGVFCFITSNFWLDVDYGKELQEFLVKYVPISGIYDCSKRSFSHALINTVITVFGAPEVRQRSLSDWISGMGGGNETIWPNIKNTAKFVMFKKPFEEVLSSQNLIDIENIKTKTKGEGITELVKNVVNTNDYRVFPIQQEDLLEDGWVYPEEYNKKKGRFKAGNYEGNKWGGKYLRAPDIFFKILDSNKIIRLGLVCKVKTGLKESGYSDYIKPRDAIKNDNFFPILKNVRKLNKIEILQNDSFIIKNIKHFEKSTKEKHSRILWPAMRGDKHFCLFNPRQFTFTGNFFGIEPDDKNVEKQLLLVLNSTLTFMIFEILARKGFGGGSAIMVKSDLDNHMAIFDPSKIEIKKSSQIIDKISRREIKPIFEELGIDPDKPIREQEPKPLPDRAELDNIIFDELGLTKEERKEVYWAVCELVKQRLEKARSLRE